MTDFLPPDLHCNESVQLEAVRKLTVLLAAADELPVFIVHDVRDFSVVYMSPLGLELLGTTLTEVRQLRGEYFTRFFNPADVEFYLPRFMEVLQKPIPAQWFSFFQQVATGKEKAFEWYLSASRPFVYDEQGAPLLALTFALQLDPNHHLAEKAERLMDENLFLKDNYQRFASLTKREKELLHYIALGYRTMEISERTHISEKTMRTHRRNIKRKIGAKTHYDIIKFAQAFNMV